MSDATEFFKTAIADVQSTIRAVDAKVTFLSAAILLPIVGFDKFVGIFFYCENAFIEILYYFLLFVGLAAWILSIYSVFKCLNPTLNPAPFMPDYEVIEAGESSKPQGTFFLGMANKFKIFSKLECKYKSEVKWVDQAKLTEKQIFIEYQYEHAKLCFIRDIKVVRQKRAYLAYQVFLVTMMAVAIIRIISISCSCSNNS